MDSQKTEVELPESTKRWLARKLKLLRRRDDFSGMTIEEFMKCAEDVPEFHVGEVDDAYRDGFEEGFDYCLELLSLVGWREEPSVGVNKLEEWSRKVLQKWRYHGEGKHKNDALHHPLYED